MYTQKILFSVYLVRIYIHIHTSYIQAVINYFYTYTYQLICFKCISNTYYTFFSSPNRVSVFINLGVGTLNGTKLAITSHAMIIHLTALSSRTQLSLYWLIDSLRVCYIIIMIHIHYNEKEICEYFYKNNLPINYQVHSKALILII